MMTVGIMLRILLLVFFSGCDNGGGDEDGVNVFDPVAYGGEDENDVIN